MRLPMSAKFALKSKRILIFVDVLEFINTDDYLFAFIFGDLLRQI